MVSLAIRDNPFFEVANLELERPGPSFTVDTVRICQDRFGAKTQLFFIMGSDSILEIDTWKDPSDLFDLCQVVVVSRPGFSTNSITSDYRDRIHFVEIPNLGISSTLIRGRRRYRQSISYLVPPAVERFILRNGLYAYRT